MTGRRRLTDSAWLTGAWRVHELLDEFDELRADEFDELDAARTLDELAPERVEPEPELDARCLS